MATITPQIVNLNATVTKAPTPSTLQRSGAIVSVGGTTLTTNTYQYCGSVADLDNVLSALGNYQELSYMANSFFAQGNSVGFYVLELGVGANVDAEIASLHTWIIDNPDIFYDFLVPASWDGSKDTVGSVTITNAGSGYTAAPTVTFSPPTSGTTATGTATIANGSVVSVTITDPGSGYTSAPTVTFSAPTSGVTATGTANLASAMDALCSDYASPTSKMYFFITTTSSTVANYTGQKSAITFVDAPTMPSTSFDAAAMLYQHLVNNPAASNRLAPMSYRYTYGTTAWPSSGQTTEVNNVLSAYGNLIYTGAEGGISTDCIFKGTTMDGVQISWWYGIDWAQIQIKQAMAAAIINGSNSNPPLLYDQAGINSLLAVAENVGQSAVEFGCALSVTITATSFQDYITANPGDYTAGIYNGFSATIVGPGGFLTITFNLDAVQF